jgi:membrane protein implicated in regulation of membrane protease activity
MPGAGPGGSRRALLRSRRPGSYHSRNDRARLLLVIAIVVAIVWLPSPYGWIVVGVAAVLEIGETFFWLWYTRRRKAKVGAQTMIGRTAVVSSPCLPEGQVRIDGEIWKARCEEGAARGAPVTIVALDGLTLDVQSQPAAEVDSPS